MKPLHCSNWPSPGVPAGEVGPSEVYATELTIRVLSVVVVSTNRGEASVPVAVAIASNGLA